METKDLYNKIELLVEENRRLKAEIIDLKAQLSDEDKKREPYPVQTKIELVPDEENNKNIITMNSSKEDKIKLYLSLFRGREDVCAKRWRNKPGYSPYCFNDFKEGICNKPKVKCSECKNSSFAPLDEERIEGHLLGKYVLGIYPMKKNDTCYFLAMDFDEATWKIDIQAVLGICRRNQIPAYTERSRSGNGGHVWFFFENEVKASSARKFGMSILSMAMKECGSINFTSYDRLFPSQDFLQKEGYGNLIALPLQKEAREEGNSVFVDDNFLAIQDQWTHLSEMKRISQEELMKISRMVSSLDEHVDAMRNEHEKSEENIIDLNHEDFSHILYMEKGRGIKVAKAGLSPKALYFLRELASYANPEFFAKQGMRQTTYGIPRMTVVYDEDENSIILPRGKEKALLEKLKALDIKYQLKDKRNAGESYPMTFCGQLTEHQEEAFSALRYEENGVLSATTGFGKTVIGTRLIVEKKCNALVLVHTKELADQWKKRLEEFLKIDVDIESIADKRKRKRSVIGQLGGGKNTLNGIVDIAIMQSLFEKDKNVKSLIDHYGLIIVDECHHISAKNFSRILSSAKAKYIFGLTATPIRKDGHHPIIFMHCGPVRYRVDAKQEALKRSFDHYILPRFTNVRMPMEKEQKDWHITEIYKNICESETRNNLIVEDVMEAVEDGRNPLVLTERATHVMELSILLEEKDMHPIVLTGRLKSSERKEAVSRIASIKDGEKFVILATGKLVGEGFDVPRLDTLFMAMPIAWKGTITQYTGRLHRSFESKKEVLIYDYVDVHIPVLERMYLKRLSAYKALGYSLRSQKEQDLDEGIFDRDNYFKPLMEDIMTAKTSILISTTFITRRKLDALRETLIRKYQTGVRITINIKMLEEYTDNHRRNMVEILQDLENQGIRIIFTPGNYLKFMMMDKKVIWYGGMDLLSDKYGNESIIRIKNETLANEMIGVLLKENQYD